MESELIKQHNYFIKHKDELRDKYKGRHVVIRNEQIIADFDSIHSAYEHCSNNFKAGTYVIESCAMENLVLGMPVNTFSADMRFNYKAESKFDTNSSITRISQKVIDNLNLVPIGIKKINHLEGKSFVKKFLINLDIAEGLIMQNVLVEESFIKEENIDLYLGMNVIRLGFLYTSSMELQFGFSAQSISQAI